VAAVMQDEAAAAGGQEESYGNATEQPSKYDKAQ
jgi:hypothetical protein